MPSESGEATTLTYLYQLYYFHFIEGKVRAVFSDAGFFGPYSVVDELLVLDFVCISQVC